MKIEKKTSSKLSEIPSPQTMTRQARDNCKVVPSEFSIAMKVTKLYLLGQS